MKCPRRCAGLPPVGTPALARARRGPTGCRRSQPRAPVTESPPCASRHLRFAARPPNGGACRRAARARPTVPPPCGAGLRPSHSARWLVRCLRAVAVGIGRAAKSGTPAASARCSAWAARTATPPPNRRRAAEVCAPPRSLWRPAIPRFARAGRRARRVPRRPAPGGHGPTATPALALLTPGLGRRRRPRWRSASPVAAAPLRRGARLRHAPAAPLVLPLRAARCARLGRSAYRRCAPSGVLPRPCGLPGARSKGRHRPPKSAGSRKPAAPARCLASTGGPFAPTGCGPLPARTSSRPTAPTPCPRPLGGRGWPPRSHVAERLTKRYSFPAKASAAPKTPDSC